MSGTRIKALKTLVKVRERQAVALKEAVDQAKQQLADARAELETAQGAEREAMQAEEAAVCEMDGLTRGAFTPQALRALEFRIADRRSEAAQATRQVRERETLIGRAEAVVSDAVRAVRVNERRIESFREQIDKIVKEREAALEELAEEETEEASTARFVARARAAAQEASHG